VVGCLKFISRFVLVDNIKLYFLAGRAKNSRVHRIHLNQVLSLPLPSIMKDFFDVFFVVLGKGLDVCKGLRNYSFINR